MTHQEYVESVKSAALTIATRGVQALLVTIPWTQLPVIKQIINYAVEIILKMAIQYTEFGAFFFYLDLRTSTQKTEFDTAAFVLAQLRARNASPEEIKKAEDEVISIFRKFAKFTN